MSRKSKKALLPVYAQAIVVLDMFFLQRHAIDMLKSNHGVGGDMRLPYVLGGGRRSC